MEMARKTGRDVTLIAAGEQRDLKTGERIMYERRPSRRIFAVEDYLGCGAIVSYMSLPKSGEAIACELAFKACEERLEEILLKSFSGQYLVKHRRIRDVEHAARLNLYDVVPVMRAKKIERFS